MVGIIPACAGNTSRISRTRPRPGDHPRVCGEHSSRASTRSSTSGSSPRVRGTLLNYATRPPKRGIIPACAGNTPRCIGSARAGRDHPRVCGEHIIGGVVAFVLLGSSPRVRGTLGRWAFVGVIAGIIPACAGNTPGARKIRRWRGDHPRVCGEHSKKSQFRIARFLKRPTFQSVCETTRVRPRNRIPHGGVFCFQCSKGRARS